MFYLRYAFAELRRRKGRTIVTALGLGIGVGLVVTVVALSNGLDQAQSEVLEPLTGVGTDMSVSRPLQVSGSGGSQTFQPGSGPPQLSAKEQSELRKENGGVQFGLQNLGDPGTHFSRDNFVTTNLSFPQADATKVEKVDGVSGAAPALTLNLMHVSGKVPKTTTQSLAGPPGAGGGPPNSIHFDQSTISGVDTADRDLALVTPSQVIRGSYFSAAKNAERQAVVSQSYANQKNLSAGDTIKVSNHEFKIVGVAQAPLGGQVSDIYIHLDVLQKLSDHQGRINVLQVRADSADQVGAVSKAIKNSFAGAQVTTAQDLAKRVSGSLVDAKNLSSKLGTALAIVALAAAFLIATLLTLSSVSKRTRELGTLKAIGWRQRLVVRQVTAESLGQGAIGALLGVAIGIGGAALITAFGPTLQATVAGTAAAAGPGGGPGPGGPLGAFGQGQIAGGSSSISLSAPVDVSALLLAIALALLGGLLAGAIGATRAARLRPAEALRSLE